MDDIQGLEYLFQTLSDRNRLKIIQYIGSKTCSVSELVEATGLSQPLVSHHLKDLRDKQVLETERKGPFVYHKLKDIRILDALGIFSEIAGKISVVKYPERAFTFPLWCKAHWEQERR